MNACAVEFVQELIGNDIFCTIETVENVRKQWHKIDVSALVNNQYFLVIEDKKATQEHSDQLNTYRQTAHREYSHLNIEIKPVYFKMEEQGDYRTIEKAGFFIFPRSKMLSILEKYVSSTESSKQND